MPRIASLLPAATEIVCALGAAAELVGISHECDFPPEARDRPVLTRSRIDADAPSQAIDAAVRAVLRDALSLYTIDEERLAAAAPDLILTQDLCEVCAVSLDDVRAAVGRLLGPRGPGRAVRIVSLRPTRLADVLDDVEHVAAAIGREAAGGALRASLAARMAAVSARAAGAARPRVASIEWLAPLMLGGTWMPELIAAAGGEAVGAAAGAPAPTLSAAALAALRPEVVLVKPCGFPLGRTLGERPLLEALLAPLGAATRVYVTDGNAYFNRPGPRLAESLEILAACTHPDLFPDLAARHRDVIVRLR